MRKVRLKIGIDDIPAGAVAVVDHCASGFHIWHDGELRRNVGVGWDAFEILGEPTPSEKPRYLHPYYVPSFAYYGHHLYLDDLWLNHRDLETLGEVARLCGVELGQFPYPQAFCKWFMEQYPDGVFYEALCQNPRQLSCGNRIV